MHWSADYIGLPFADRGRDRSGVDCWGLVRLVYGEMLGLHLPSYEEAYASVSERAEIAALLTGACRGPRWTLVASGEARAFDVVLFAARGRPLHVGVTVAHGEMLHVSAGHDSRIERYLGGAWLPRFLGHHRYVPS